MKPTAGFKNGISEAGLPIPDFVLNNAIAFNPADSMFNANAQRSMPLVNALLQVRQGFAFGLLFRLKDGDIVESEALEAGILTQFTPFRQGITGFIRQFFVVFPAFNRVAEKPYLAR